MRHRTARRFARNPDILFDRARHLDAWWNNQISNQFFRIGNIGKFDAFNYPIFSAEDGMSSSHEKFPDRTADFSKAGEEGGKAIENATDAAASLLSSD